MILTRNSTNRTTIVQQYSAEIFIQNHFIFVLSLFFRFSLNGSSFVFSLFVNLPRSDYTGENVPSVIGNKPSRSFQLPNKGPIQTERTILTFSVTNLNLVLIKSAEENEPTARKNKVVPEIMAQ